MVKNKNPLKKYVRINSEDLDIDNSLMTYEGFAKYNGRTVVFLRKVTIGGNGDSLIEVPGYITSELQVNLKEKRIEYDIETIPKGQERKDITEILMSYQNVKRFKFWN